MFFRKTLSINLFLDKFLLIDQTLTKWIEFIIFFSINHRVDSLLESG